MARAFPQRPGIIPIGPQGPYAPQPSVPPGGYAIRSTDPNPQLALGRTIQTFCAFPTFNNEQNTQDIFQGVTGLKQFDVGINGCAWMITSIQALQVARRADNVGGREPISSSQIVNAIAGTGNNPAGFLSANRYSNLRARITWNDGSAQGRSVDIDIAGGISIQTYSRSVSVDIITPEESYLVNGGDSTPAFGGAGADARIVYDSLVSARCAPVDSLGAYILSRTPQLTESEVRFNSTASNEIPIPSGADSVKVTVGDAGTGAQVAAIAFVGGVGETVTRSVAGELEVGIPSYATALRILANGPAADYRYTAIFSISP